MYRVAPDRLILLVSKEKKKSADPRSHVAALPDAVVHVIVKRRNDGCTC